MPFRLTIRMTAPETKETPVRYARQLITIITTLAGLLAAVFLVILACHSDRDISTDIWIDSPPQVVWQVLTATRDYPSWNPMIARVNGELREGNVIEIDAGMVFRPRILAFRVDQELRWKGHVWIPGIFDGEHRFVLEAHGNQTRLIQGEEFTGILAGRITREIIDDTIVAMKGMNSALKARTESLVPVK
jgi:hypothetical protein